MATDGRGAFTRCGPRGLRTRRDARRDSRGRRERLVTGLLSVAALLSAGFVVGRRAPELGSLSAPRSGRVSLAVELVALFLLAALSTRVLLLAAATDLDLWDAWAMWGPKAHALFVEGDIWGPVFSDREYVMQHPEYPVLLPVRSVRCRRMRSAASTRR